jgi:virginiamycin B lyase
MPDPKSRLSNLAAAPDGSVWVAEYDANKIVSIGTDDAVRTYVVPTANSQPDAIAVDSGGVVWFTELDTDRIGQVTADRTIRDALLPYTLSSPIFVFAGPSQTLYVIGLQSHWLGLYRTFVVARIPAASAF